MIMKRKYDEHNALPPYTPFSPDASIALIGLRGVGKSTIGVIASTALRRRLIDQSSYFTSKAGMTIKQFVSTRGWPSYCNKQAEILEEIFREHGNGAVVVCSSDCVERQRTRDLLREWCREHPVIHIIRPPEEVAECLWKKSPKDRRTQFLRLAAKRESIYSTCSNYEFFNWRDSDSPSPPLKKLEQHFLQLLNPISQTDISSLVGRRYRLSMSSMHNVGVESRAYTYALALPGKGGSLEDLDLEEMETAVEAFELRVDNLITAGDVDFRRISHQFSYLRRNSVLPIIYHVSRQADSDYLQLLIHAFRLGADYVVVDLELDEGQLQEVVQSKGSTKLIGSWFDENGGWDDNKRREMYEFADRLGCDFVKLTQEAKTMDDNLAAISFARNIGKGRGPPLIAYNTGPIGKLSRIFNPILSPVTHPSMGRADELTPKEALRALHSCSAFPKLHFYIFGTAVAHSLSPSLHNAAFDACGLPHKCRIYESPTLNGLHQLQDANFGGVGVAFPYKQEVIPLLQTLSQDAKAIGAVNTIIPIRRDGKVKALHGENTDWVGIRSCILRNLTSVNAITSRSTALVCGAGGMGQAAIYALQKVGVENVFLCNSTEQRAHELAKQFNNNKRSVHVVPSPKSRWPEGYPLPSVIVSCIPSYALQGSEMSDFVIPDEWLQSRTGGVCIEVCQTNFTLMLAWV